VGDKARERCKIAQNPPLEDRIRALAGRQFGHVTRKQLLDLGLGRGAIRARLGSGAFDAVFSGVYALAPRRTDPVARAAAAVLACGPGAVLSHASAAALWEMTREWPSLPEVTITAGDRRPTGIIAHRCRTLTRPDSRHHRGIWATSPARTVLDIAPTTPSRQLTRIVNDFRRSGHLHLATLTDLLERCPTHPGTRYLRPFAEDRTEPTRSGFEDDFRVFAARYGFPTPLINTKVLGREVDALFPNHKLIVELDGWEFHKDHQSFNDDRANDADALKYGFATMRITEDRVRETPDAEAQRLQEILRARWREIQRGTAGPGPS
jgi:hypothetical protein